MIKSEVIPVTMTDQKYTQKIEKIRAQFFICPYNATHFVSKKKFAKHLQRCARNSTIKLQNLTNLTSKVKTEEFHLDNGVFVVGLSVEAPAEVKFASTTKKQPQKSAFRRFEERFVHRRKIQKRRKGHRHRDYDQRRPIFVVKSEQK